MTTPPPIKTRLIDTVNGLDLHESTEGNLYATAPGDIKPVGGAWGPAADNANWFAWRAGTDPERVEDRDVAISYITAVRAEAVS